MQIHTHVIGAKVGRRESLSLNANYPMPCWSFGRSLNGQFFILRADRRKPISSHFSPPIAMLGGLVGAM